MRNSGSVLQWAPQQLQEDLQVALAAVQSNPAASEFVAQELKKKRHMAFTPLFPCDIMQVLCKTWL